MNKPDQLWAERFFRECLSQLNAGNWNFELTFKNVGDDKSLGSTEVNIGRQMAYIDVFTKAHDGLADLEDTLAHEALEVAVADLTEFFSGFFKESQAEYLTKLLHKIIEPCAAILAKAVHAEVNSD